VPWVDVALVLVALVLVEQELVAADSAVEPEHSCQPLARSPTSTGAPSL
jgi:hypothetical protein